MVNGFHKVTYKYADNTNNIVENAVFDTKGNPVNVGDGFHKIVITYNDEGTVALTCKYYRANGTLLVTRNWNGHDWVIGGGQVDWKEAVSEKNRECPYEIVPDVLTVQYVRATGNRDCEIKFVVHYAKNEMTSEQLDALKQAVQEVTRGVEEQLGHKPYVTGNLYDKNGTSLYSVRI